MADTSEQKQKACAPLKIVNTYRGKIQVAEEWVEVNNSLTYEAFLKDEIKARLDKRYLFTEYDTMEYSHFNPTIKLSKKETYLVNNLFKDLNAVQAPADNIIEIVAE